MISRSISLVYREGLILFIINDFYSNYCCYGFRSERYLGMWRNDKRHGPGILAANNKFYYSGNYDNGEKKVRYSEACTLIIVAL